MGFALLDAHGGAQFGSPDLQLVGSANRGTVARIAIVKGRVLGREWRAFYRSDRWIICDTVSDGDFWFVVERVLD